MQEIINITSSNTEIEYEDLSELKSKRVLLLSMVNNCSHSYEYIKNFIVNISKNVGYSSFHYITNNNIDGTVFLLENLSKYTNTTGTILPNISINQSNRLEIFARMRNILFNNSLAIAGCNFDYVVIFDSDLICNIPHQSVLESFLVKGEWSSISANSIFSSMDYHYDVFALRLLNESDNIRDIYDRFDQGYGKSSSWIKLYNFETWFEVKSAFGGLTIYKMPELVSILERDSFLYNLEGYPEYTCEHVTLANKLAGKKLINPNIKYAGTIT